MASPSKKLERELYGPSVFEITLGAALSLILGALLAAGYLAAQPVETLRALPREPDPDKVYYITGSYRSSQGSGWQRKKQRLLEPGAITVQLTEDELNTWLRSSEMQAEQDDNEGGIITVEQMNFRIADGSLQVGLPCEVSVFGRTYATVVQTQGDFVKSGDQFVYNPTEVMVGHLGAHRLPLVGSFIAGRLAAIHDVPDELEEAWETLSDVRVEGRELVLVRE